MGEPYPNIRNYTNPTSVPEFLDHNPFLPQTPENYDDDYDLENPPDAQILDLDEIGLGQPYISSDIAPDTAPPSQSSNDFMDIGETPGSPLGVPASPPRTAPPFMSPATDSNIGVDEWGRPYVASAPISVAQVLTVDDLEKQGIGVQSSDDPMDILKHTLAAVQGERPNDPLALERFDTGSQSSSSSSMIPYKPPGLKRRAGTGPGKGDVPKPIPTGYKQSVGSVDEEDEGSGSEGGGGKKRPLQKPRRPPSKRLDQLPPASSVGKGREESQPLGRTRRISRKKELDPLLEDASRPSMEAPKVGEPRFLSMTPVVRGAKAACISAGLASTFAHTYWLVFKAGANYPEIVSNFKFVYHKTFTVVASGVHNALNPPENEAPPGPGTGLANSMPLRHPWFVFAPNKGRYVPNAIMLEQIAGLPHLWIPRSPQDGVLQPPISASAWRRAAREFAQPRDGHDYMFTLFPSVDFKAKYELSYDRVDFRSTIVPLAAYCRYLVREGANKGQFRFAFAFTQKPTTFFTEKESISKRSKLVMQKIADDFGMPVKALDDEYENISMRGIDEGYKQPVTEAVDAVRLVKVGYIWAEYLEEAFGAVLVKPDTGSHGDLKGHSYATLSVLDTLTRAVKYIGRSKLDAAQYPMPGKLDPKEYASTVGAKQAIRAHVYAGRM